MNPLRHKFLPISFVIAVIGLFFSVYNILSVFLFEKVCTDNCSVFANFTIMGFSLWWLGAIFFAGILILSLFGCAYVIRILTAAALFFDIFLLLIMVNTTLCIVCIIAGILLACSYYAVRYENRRPIAPYPKTLLLSVWCFLFVLLIGSAINANQRGVPFIEIENPSTKIFFSPSCTACKDILEKEHTNKNIAWFPVEENGNDIWRIMYMWERLEAGDTLYQALLNSEKRKPEEHVDFFDVFSFRYFVIQYRVWKNTAIVKRRTSFIPYIEIFGAPKDLPVQTVRLEQSAVMETETNISALIGKETTLCGDEAKPCEE